MKKNLFVTLVLLSPFSFAGGATDYSSIDKINVHTDWTMVHLESLAGAAGGTTNNPDSCASTHYYAISPLDTNYAAMHSTLLAAQVAGKQIAFFVSGCEGQLSKYPKIAAIYMLTD